MSDELIGIAFLILIFVLFFGGLLIATVLTYIFCPHLREEILRDWKGEVK